ncbi:MAG: glycosyltransferase family 4 protein [Patescibacteria group bacterium]
MQRPLKVGILSLYYPKGSGSGTYNCSLMAELARCGVEVHFLSPSTRQEAELEFGTQFPLARGDQGEPGRVLFHPSPNSFQCPRLVAYARADMPDGVEIEAAGDTVIASYIETMSRWVRDVSNLMRLEVLIVNHVLPLPAVASRSGIPYVVIPHGTMMTVAARAPRRFHGLMMQGLEGARKVLCLNDDVTERLRTQIRTHSPDGIVDRLSQRFVPLPQGVDSHIFSADAVLPLDAPWLNRTVPKAIWFGQILRSKGPDLAVAAWPLVFQRHPQADLTIVGRGAFSQDLTAFIEVLTTADPDRVVRFCEEKRLDELRAFYHGLQGSDREAYFAVARMIAKHVRYLGYFPQASLAGILVKHDVALVTSIAAEAAPTVIHEAAICGVVPIGIRHSGVRQELGAYADISVRGYDLAELIMVSASMREVIPDLAGKVISVFDLLAVPSDRAHIRQGLMVRAREHSWPVIAQRLLAIFSDVIAT